MTPVFLREHLLIPIMRRSYILPEESGESSSRRVLSSAGEDSDKSILTWFAMEYCPTLFLMLVNGCVVPFAVYWITYGQRFWHKQRMHLSSLWMNYVLMFTNLIVIPILGVDSFGALFHTMWGGVATAVHEGWIGHTGPGYYVQLFVLNFPQHMARWRIFALKYLISNLLISSMQQVIQGPQTLVRHWYSFTATTKSDRKEALTQYEFDYGYW